MVEVNRLTTTANMHWRFVDRTTGAATTAIDWRFTRRRSGEDPAGQRDGLRPPHAPPVPPARRRPLPGSGPRRRAQPNLVWKDTVLVRTGQTVDIMFDVTNPGLWMAHCHIAEHMQSGMMFSGPMTQPAGHHVPDALGDADSHESGSSDGIEWEDDMVEVNRLTTTATMHWRFVDRTSGAPTTEIDWRFTVGDRVKIRLVNEMDSDHPMHHPFHLHGAGRFLVLARNDEPETNLVWKDTVLVRTGQTVDIMFDVTNPGLWMAHCHIAEHMQSGMMFSFIVDRGTSAPAESRTRPSRMDREGGRDG